VVWKTTVGKKGEGNVWVCSAGRARLKDLMALDSGAETQASALK
jgi:hypothetical protein